jgi:VTC domain
MAGAPDRTLSSRYELKYWLPPQLVPEVRRHLRPFTRLDPFSMGRPGGRYAISSLYLDTPDFDLYRTTVEGHRNRFKLRIRAYTDRPEDPVFFEVKKRADLVVRKTRARVPRDVAERFLAGEPVPSQGGGFDEFVQAYRRMGARSKVRVRYEREAHESTGGDPVRVTFDTSVSHAITPRPSLLLNGPGWVDTPTEGVILEVKFTDNCPSWVPSMIRDLGLERNSIPKYVLSLDRAFATHGRAAFSHPSGYRA